MMTPIDQNLWICDQKLKFLGVEVGTRMTVMRLPGERLLLYSPARPLPELRAAVDQLGTVSWLVSPNRFHHLFVKDWMEAYPKAEAHGAPGLAKKRPDVAFTAVLGDVPAAGWAADIEQVAWQGAPAMNEVAMLHRPSRTLVVADLVHNVGAEKPWLSRVFYGALGGYGGFKTNLLDRAATRDRPAARGSLARVQAWNFDRVVMCHGSVLETGGRSAWQDAYAWLARGRGGPPCPGTICPRSSGPTICCGRRSPKACAQPA
jgi:hypothetical protein